jgi:hypothetical protein
MSLRFFTEDGLGGVYNEDGSEVMDWDEEDDNPYKTETLTSLGQWRARQSIFEPTIDDPVKVDVVMEELEQEIARSKKIYNIYTDEQKALFLYLINYKFLKAAPAGERTGIKARTAQSWVKRMKEDPEWDIYEKLTNKVNRPASQLQEEHKDFLINFFDEQPQATREDAVESLTAAFEGFTLKSTQVGTFIKNDCNLTLKRVTRHPVTRNSEATLIKRKEWIEKWFQTDVDYMNNCIFVDESAFDINMRPAAARSTKGTPAVVTTPSARAVSHTILGAISAFGVVNIEIRLPNSKPKRIKVDGSRKRKQPPPKKPTPKGTVTGHYILFLQKTMNLMDQFPEMKGFYIVMDNAPIHTADEIEEMISNRGYRSIYLPPYSPELNPIENFWSTMKSHVKRTKFNDTDDLKMRIAEASNEIRPSTLRNISQHSVNMFEKCLRMEPL